MCVLLLLLVLLLSRSDVELYAEKVRRAISSAAVLLDNDWARLNDCAGKASRARLVIWGIALCCVMMLDSSDTYSFPDHVRALGRPAEGKMRNRF